MARPTQLRPQPRPRRPPAPRVSAGTSPRAAPSLDYRTGLRSVNRCSRGGGSRRALSRRFLCPLLPRHGDAQALLGRDQVVGVLGVLPKIDLHPVDLSREDAAFALVVVADG